MSTDRSLPCLFHFQSQKMSASSIAAQALYAYQGRTDAELSFEKDAVITNVAMLEGDCEKKKKKEIFPFFLTSIFFMQARGGRASE
jgi:hypothetical protein